MTSDTAQFLLGILDTVTLNVGAPDFEETAGRVIAARRELRLIVDEAADRA